MYGVLFLQSSKKLKLAAREFGIRDMVSVRVRASCHSGVSASIDRPIVADTPIHELVTYYTTQTTKRATCVRIGRICAIRYDTRRYFNVRSKADMSQLTLPHGTNNYKKLSYRRETARCVVSV